MKLQNFVQDKPVLETDQLILRPLRKEDVADLKEWLGDSSVYRYWGKRPGTVPSCGHQLTIVSARNARR